jgi:hypothetical protein
MNFPIGIAYKALKPADKAALKEDAGCCALCGKRDGLNVDHCHTTGVVRGVLCGSCNLKIGWIEALSLSFVEAAEKYLGDKLQHKQLLRTLTARFERHHEQWISEIQELQAEQELLEAKLSKSMSRKQEIELRLNEIKSL